MLSFRPIAASGGVPRYGRYIESSAKNEHLDRESGSHCVGRWHGKFAAKLGLTGEVKAGQLAAVLKGFDPRKPKARLAKNAGDQHKQGWDLCFSAPKSVSLVWGIGNESVSQKIEHAHEMAIRSAIDYLQKHGAFVTRSRVEPEIAEIAGAIFQHGLSRELDCALHSHAIEFNLAENTNGRICAIDFDARWKMPAGAFYRAELANRCQQLGFKIAKDRDSFRIATFPKSVERAFSKRRDQIETALAEGGSSAKGNANVAMLTRKKKKSVAASSLQILWKAKARQFGITPEAIDAMKTDGTLSLETMPVPAMLIRQMTQAASTVSVHQLHREICRQSQGKLDAEGIKHYLQNVQTDPEIIFLSAKAVSYRQRFTPTEIRFTSQEMVGIESKIGALARTMFVRDVGSNSAFPETHRSEQTDLEQEILRPYVTYSKQISAIQLSPRLGIGHLLNLIVVELERSKQTAVGCAPTDACVKKLPKNSGIPFQSVRELLVACAKDKTSIAGMVVIVAHADAVASRQMYELMVCVISNGARLIVIGDSQTVDEVDLGGAFRTIASVIGDAELAHGRPTESVPMSSPLQYFRDSDIGKNMTGLFETPNTRVIVAADPLQAQVDDWSANRDSTRPMESIMLADTLEQVDCLNELARQSNVGVRPSISISTKRGIRKLSVGERVIFGSNFAQRKVARGTLATVENLSYSDQGSVAISMTCDDGKQIRFLSRDFCDIDYAYAINFDHALKASHRRAHVLITSTIYSAEKLAVVLHEECQATYFMSTETASLMKRAIALPRPADPLSVEQDIDVSTDVEMAPTDTKMPTVVILTEDLAPLASGSVPAGKIETEDTIPADLFEDSESSVIPDPIVECN